MPGPALGDMQGVAGNGGAWKAGSNPELLRTLAQAVNSPVLWCLTHLVKLQCELWESQALRKRESPSLTSLGVSWFILHSFLCL